MQLAVCSTNYQVNSNAKWHIVNITSRSCLIDKNMPVYVKHQSLRWRHNGHGCVSNHQPHHCLPNRLFGCRSKKASKLRVTGLCAGNSPGPVNSPHKGPVTRKVFPFDDVIMATRYWLLLSWTFSQHQTISLSPCTTLTPGDLVVIWVVTGSCVW